MSKRLITTARLAQICGVSQGTVDRALNGRQGISQETREKILHIAREYGYRPGPQQKKRMIGVIVFDLHNEYFSDLLMEIEASCAVRDCSVIVMFSDKNSQRERECIEQLYVMGVDGLLLFPVNQGAAFENFLQSLGLPVITLGNRLGNLPYVGIDHYAAMEKTVAYVMEKGYRRLIYIHPQAALETEKNAHAQVERYRAFRETAEKYGVSWETCLGIQEIQRKENLGSETALICAMDLYALQLWEFARRQGMGIIGFDNLKLLQSLEIPLDSVACNRKSVARGAVEGLLNGKPESLITDFRIISRGSI